jgi:hypothetical protein
MNQKELLQQELQWHIDRIIDRFTDFFKNINISYNVEQYIKDLPTLVSPTSEISDDNRNKIKKLRDFFHYLSDITIDINNACEQKQNQQIKDDIIKQCENYTTGEDFVDWVVNKGYQKVIHYREALITNSYIPSIADNLGMNTKDIKKFLGFGKAYWFSPEYAYLIDFVKDTSENPITPYQNGHNKKNLGCSLSFIKREINNFLKNLPLPPPFPHSHYVCECYMHIKDKLNEDLKNVYDIKDTNGQLITNFSQVQHKFEYLSSEITDNPA